MRSGSRKDLIKVFRGIRVTPLGNVYLENACELADMFSLPSWDFLAFDVVVSSCLSGLMCLTGCGLSSCTPMCLDTESELNASSTHGVLLGGRVQDEEHARPISSHRLRLETNRQLRLAHGVIHFSARVY